MKSVTVTVAAMALAACGNDVQPPEADPDAAGAVVPDAPPDAPEMMTDVSADLATDTTWSGLVRIHTDITIATGATLTVLPHTRIQIAAGVSISVAGTATLVGTKGAVVTIEPLVAAENWNAFVVSSGTLSLSYVVSTGGGITVSGAGAIVVRDSQLSTVTHDLLVVSGGTIDVQYSWIGLAKGQPDTTHCDMHVEGGGPTLTISHTNISTSLVGMMFYTGLNADLTYDNWFGNGVDLDEQAGPPVTGDVSYSWFEAGNPAWSGLTRLSMATGPIANAGPR